VGARLVLLAAVPALALARGAAAQAYSDTGFGVGAHVSVSKAAGAESGTVTGGVQARARLTGGLGVEALVTYRREEYAAAGVKVLRVEEVPFQGSVQLFLLFRTPVQPYVLAGGGYYYIRATGLGPNPRGRTTENRFAFHAGAGVDVRVAGRASVHADLRYVLLDVGAVQDASERFGSGASSHFWHAVAGASFSF
jgi:opacity protein-like surface antigen